MYRILYTSVAEQFIMGTKTWEVISKKLVVQLTTKDIISELLANRGIKDASAKSAFLQPKSPQLLTLSEVGLKKKDITKALFRIKKAIDGNEDIVIYGDYDADGVCATAIIWETLYALTKHVAPHIPNRFSEGYGINPGSVETLKKANPNLKLIITVDNGIVAHEGVAKANDLGIDVIVTDHHAREKKLPNAYATLHTTSLSGSGIAWLFSRETANKFKSKTYSWSSELELAAIGTVADQIPLTGVNRSVVKWGLQCLSNTTRPGLLALFQEAGIEHVVGSKTIGTYDVNYLIAPRINAMGRMEHAIDSLRLICTKDVKRASELAAFLGRTNRVRQKTVDEVVSKALDAAKVDNIGPLIIIGDYHEGVIGLAAGKLVESFYRPAIVISKGGDVSKASARSIEGFDIISTIRQVDHLIEGGGGHPMAAGFTIKTENIVSFVKAFKKIAKPKLSDEILKRKLKVDIAVSFTNLTDELFSLLTEFEPFGFGNATPVFMSRQVNIIEAKRVGSSGQHLKLSLRDGDRNMPAIGFNLGEVCGMLGPEKLVDIAYTLEENVWKNQRSLQLRVKDIKVD